MPRSLVLRHKKSLSIETNLAHASLSSNHASNRSDKTSAPKPKMHLNPYPANVENLESS